MKIGVENFKIFKDKVEFDFGGVIVITGPNGSGKSTLIDLVKLMLHNFKDGPQRFLDTSIISGGNSLNVAEYLENFERSEDDVTFYYNSKREGYFIEVSYRFTEGIYEFSDVKIYSRGIQLVERTFYDELHYIELNIKKYKELIGRSVIPSTGVGSNGNLFYAIPEKYREFPIRGAEKKHRSEIIENLLKMEYDNYEMIENSVPLYTPIKYVDKNIFLVSEHPELRLDRFQRISFSLYDTEKLAAQWRNQMIQIFDIGDKIVLNKIKKGVYDIKVSRDNYLVDISDLSKGQSNIVLAIVFLSSAFTLDIIDEVRFHPMILILEELETFLHPSYQSKLAYLIEGIINFRKGFENLKYDYHVDESINYITYIFETHSEYLIRKLQYLIANGRIDPDLINLYYFESKGDFEVKPYKIDIDEKGRLSRPFGPGFFDEADNISMDLFKLQNHNLN